MSCEHAILSFAASANADNAGYRGITAQQRASTAAQDASEAQDSTYPAPLILPNDDLSLDPRCPPQSLRSWLRMKDRNEVTPNKNVIYLAAPPDVNSDVEFVRSWTQPQNQHTSAKITTPHVKDVLEYLSAFYHGLQVKPLPLPKLCFASWNSGVKSKSTILRYIGLNTSTECVRIRTRRSKDGVFTAQLNLDDLLDAAISVLPDDAYALLLLVNHDLFEGAEDQFVCGRAYGGSRVAVISTARYHPILDYKHKVERQHTWPASHCQAYIHACCETSVQSSVRPKKKAKLKNADADSLRPDASSSSSTLGYLGLPETSSPMHAALFAHKELPPIESSPSTASLSSLWLGRVCRTASHELGHCFGMEHCVYYACSMQGSSSLAEDARQPPYLCPIDLAKMLHASGATADARYRELLSFCERHESSHLFAAYAAWIRARLQRDFSESAA
ncbi:hypothetical protein D9615_003081 [Tricholomella constricta]|uniref:Archaemetzincin-2 n=1 Tax=Tricholomella constricta TaxID=117010 RepID=A0A8H5HFW0_9AGAR|nr:hypothetical protein D9615_003081 [Tricholomella constricta]